MRPLLPPSVPTAARPVRRRRAALPAALSAALLGAALAGCDDPGIYAAPETMRLALEAEQSPVWAATPDEPIDLEVEVPATVARDTDLEVRIRVRNRSTRPMAIGFGQRTNLDVVVARPGGRADSAAVWSTPKWGAVATRDVVVTDPVAPGRDTVFTVRWPVIDDRGRKVPPGDYRLRATVPAELVSRRQLWSAWLPIRVTGEP